MAVLITGGAGFIGSHTAIALLNACYPVILADDFSNSSIDVVNRMEKIVGYGIPIYSVDISDRYSLNRVFMNNKIDIVIHMADVNKGRKASALTEEYCRSNQAMVTTVLELMRQYAVKQLIFSSSAAVYGDAKALPITEDAPAGCGANPYGRTKYMIEQMLVDAAAADPLMSVVLLRYFNPIGAHESGLIGELPQGIPNNLMPYITQVAAGERPELSVFGKDYSTSDGTGVRDYIHVVDLAKGHVSALKYAQQHTGAEVFNLGTGHGYSVLELIKAFEKVNNVTIPYRFAPRRAGDVAVCYAATKKAEQVLGWRVEKNLEEMCRDAWRWQQHCADK